MLRHLRWALLWALFILVLCLIPGKDLPKVWWAEILSFDKWVHTGVFCVLVILAHQGLRDVFTARWRTPRIFLVCLAYGALLEVMQGTLMVDRYAEVADFLANAFGAAAGTWWAIKRKGRAASSTAP